MARHTLFKKKVLLMKCSYSGSEYELEMPLVARKIHDFIIAIGNFQLLYRIKNNPYFHSRILRINEFTL